MLTTTRLSLNIPLAPLASQMAHMREGTSNYRCIDSRLITVRNIFWTARLLLLTLLLTKGPDSVGFWPGASRVTRTRAQKAVRRRNNSYTRKKKNNKKI